MSTPLAVVGAIPTGALSGLLGERAQQPTRTALAEEDGEPEHGHLARHAESGRPGMVGNGHHGEGRSPPVRGELSACAPRAWWRDRTPAGRSHSEPPGPGGIPGAPNAPSWVCLREISPGGVRETLSTLTGADMGALSPEAVENLRGKWERTLKGSLSMPLAPLRITCMWARAVHVREPDPATKAAHLLVAAGIDDKGGSHLLGAEACAKVSAQCWRQMLHSMAERGLESPPVAVSYGEPGFWVALGNVFANARQQRCVAQTTHNVLKSLPRQLQGQAKADLEAIWETDTRKNAREAIYRFCRIYQGTHPQAARCLSRDITRLLSCFTMSQEHWRSLSRHVRLTRTPVNGQRPGHFPGEGQAKVHDERATSVVLRVPAHSPAPRAGNLPLSTEEDGHDDATDRLHSLHPFPAKFPPSVPQFLLGRFSRHGATVLDPFCGSGTTLVEARLHGMNAVGVDVNGLAALLSKVKSTPLSPDHAGTVHAVTREIEAVREAWAANRPPIKIREIEGVDHWFQENVAEEVTLLSDVIDSSSEGDARDFLRVILSSILVRVSNQESDVRFAAKSKGIRDLETLDMFLKKSWEGLEIMRRVSPKIGNGTTLEVHNADARDLSFLGKERVDIVVTSPPYANTYDYYLYHKFRKRWLDIDVKFAQHNEIGSRREFSSLRQSAEKWFADLGKCLQEIHGVMKRGGLCFIVIGDSVIAKNFIDMREAISSIARRVGFDVIETESHDLAQRSKTFNPAFAKRGKKEHLITLGKP